MYIPKNAFYNPNFNPYKVNCEQQVCDGIDAYVSCITDIIQGRWGCIEIQLVDKVGMPLDLSDVKSIEVIVSNSLGYVIDTWGWVKKHTQTSDTNILNIHQRPVHYPEDADLWVEWNETNAKLQKDVEFHDDDDYWVEWYGNNGSDSGSDSGSGSGDEIINKGIISLNMSPLHTYTASGPVTAQLIITTETGGVCNTFVVNCIVIANIVPSAINRICMEDEDEKNNMIFKNLNKIIIPISLQEIPLDAKVTDVHRLSDIIKPGYYRFSGSYYKCDYFTSEYDDNDKWIVYNIS